MNWKDVSLETERLGPLPLINHFLARLRVPDLLDQFVPSVDSRCRIAWTKGLGLWRSANLTHPRSRKVIHSSIAAGAPSFPGSSQLVSK